ncbi:type VII secretion-associated serine protease mycosin [Dactylosporangium maewongense]|uniref:type VII secretion-associated serine protease mycosin n=1 Tax=Dactylosporangium maewongense TaxID=634393 RepID=UPI0031D1FB7A
MRTRSAVAALVAGVLIGGAPAPAQAETVREQQWWLGALGMAKAQQVSKGEGVVVAVIDTGVDGAQPDLSGALLPGAGTNGVASEKGWDDPDGHGTQMATVLAGRGGDGANHVLGIAPKAKVLPIAIPIGNRAAGAPAGTLAEPIRYAADHGAKIINMSFTLTDDELKQPELDAISYARAKGAVLVAAGGNRPQGDDHVPLPARYPGVITVAGTTRAGGLWDGSIADPTVDIAAPAQDIIGAAPKSRYPSGFAIGSGTSGAAAIVSGLLALIWSRHPKLDAANVVNRLFATARDKGAPGRDDSFGHGLIDPYAALTATVPPVTADPLGPTASPSPPAPPTTHAPPPRASGDGPGTPAIRAAVVGGGSLLLALLLVFGVARPLLRGPRRRR